MSSLPCSLVIKWFYSSLKNVQRSTLTGKNKQAVLKNESDDSNYIKYYVKVCNQGIGTGTFWGICIRSVSELRIHEYPHEFWHPQYFIGCHADIANNKRIIFWAIFTFCPTSHSMIKTLSIGRMDNFKTFFKNGKFLFKCFVFEIKRKNREQLHTEHITKFCWLCDIECPILNILY